MTDAPAFTPGPYWIHVAADGERQIKGKHGKILFRYPAAQDSLAKEHCRRLQKDHTKAARVMRNAAYDLYDALEQVLEAFNRYVSTKDGVPAIDLAHEALRKARGSA